MFQVSMTYLIYSDFQNLINGSLVTVTSTLFNNLILCSKAVWDISQKYVHYRPSYDKLVVRIVALENV